MRELLIGAAGSSPFLCDIMIREEAWLRSAIGVPGSDIVPGLVGGVDAAAADGLGSALRTAKRRLALYVALADLGGAWTLEDVTAALSDFADAAVTAAIEAEVGREIARGRLPDAATPREAVAGGLTVIAMGKHGARELNYSSDIDLICLFDETRFDPGRTAAARTTFVRAVRRAMALLSDQTAEGYVFRTDLRLRPDPSVTPICLSVSGAERYYESLGRSWERAAFVKARPAAGDLAVGAAFLDRLRPFVWRRHLDFAAIEDAHAIRQRLRAHRGDGASGIDGRNIKLGRGGIREIEFFAQTRQLIAGGRDPGLRSPRTVDALIALSRAGWITDEASTVLREAYRAHREVEHRLQMIADLQTHDLPDDPEGWARLGALMGRDPVQLRREIAERCEGVDALVEPFFAPEVAPRREPEVVLPPEQDAIVERWTRYPALRTARSVDVFERIKPRLLRGLTRGARPERTLATFDAFLAGLPSGVQLFSLFAANPDLLDLIVDIAETGPGLAEHLSRRPEVLDSVIGGRFFDPWPGPEDLAARLETRLAAASDYEEALNAARRFRRDWQFRVGVHHLRGLVAPAEAGRQYADLAEAIVGALWPVVVDEFAERHGRPPGEGAAILAGGSFGMASMTAASDLDLFVVYDAAGEDGSEGERPLPARTYYARLTKALVTAIGAPTSEGRLYTVDMRLRPSGRQGPVAVSLSAFERYHREEAWTWEHCALTRSRPIAGAPDFRRAVEAARRRIVGADREAASVLRDVAAMRDRLAGTWQDPTAWNARAGPGRLQDIGLASTALALLAGSPERGVPAQLEAALDGGLISEGAAAALAGAYRDFDALRMASALIDAGPLDPASLSAGGEALLLRDLGGQDLGVVADRLAATAARAASHVASVLRQDEGAR